ncbi:MAG: translocation/assembly module TamB domain-containing protein, partial [Parafilimonas sp.]
TVKQAEVKGYNYQNLALTANLNKGAADIQATMDDVNIRFNLSASGNINQTYPTNLKLDLMLDTLNLNALHLMTDTISLHGRIVADMPSTNPDFLTGNMIVNNLIITTPQRTISTDSISLVANATTDNKSISITSEFLKANLEGQFKLTEFAASLQQTINKYYTLPGYKSQKLFPQNWKLDATFYPSSLLVLQFIPGMKGSDSALIAASFNSEANDLTLSLKDRRLIYNEMQFDSLNVLAKTDASKLGFNISLQSAKTSSVQLYKTTLDGSLSNKQLDAALVVNDNKGKPQYQLAALLNQIPNGIKVSVKPGDLLLNYSQWTVASDNYIQYDSMGVIVNNFKINQGNQSLSINSTSLNESAPIKVDFSNFEIATLTKIANQDSLLLGGVINGNALITNPTKNMIFTSDISIANLSYKKDTLGNATIKVNNQQANTFAADVALIGNGNDVKLNGLYYTGESRMDFKVNVNSLNLATIKPFAAGQLNDIRGIAKANLNITGTLTQPKVLGDLHFENASVVPTMSGERFTLSNEAISFTDQGIDLNNFTLKDSTGNEAILSGNIYTTDFLNYRFNVDLNAQNFRVVNIAETTNKLYYGKLNVDANIKLRGDMNSPTANAYLRVNKETDFTVLLPSSDPEIVDRTGIVNFIDKDNPVIDSSAQKTILDSLTRQSKVKGIDVSANIETDSAAKFTMVIDERNGDALTLQGRADLTGGIDKSGKTSLTGNYELTHGSYQVSLSVLKRKFQIQKGSTITWTGDPTSAIVDIIAIYYVKTAPIDLVGPQLSGRPQAELTRYKERLPFEVYLKMQGELLKPLITFDINLPESELSQWPEVDTKLQQVRADESELNKQVFALLLLGRFVQENPFQSEAGGTTGGDIARQSASRILTEQLNQLAGSLIKGVDINFDVSSGTDYTTGVAQNRTDLNVGVSKKLLNDRLRVNVGSNFELEGSPAAGQQASNIAGDVSVDYQLSKDGRYMIRVYRKNEYQQVVEGQVIETGVSFILTMDYNKFNELFKNRKEKRQARKEVKESKKEPLPATPQ